MGLLCASCGYDNDPTRVYCHSCGTKLERGGQAPPAPSGFMHPTDVAKMKKPRQPADWGRYGRALVRLAVLAGLVTAVVLALLRPSDVPAPVAADPALAERLAGLVYASAGASGTRAFSIPAAEVNTWLVSSVALRGQDSQYGLKPQRVYAVPGRGDLRIGLEAVLPPGLPLFFEGRYVPKPEGRGYGLAARRYSVGRLPLPSFAGLLVERQLNGLAAALQGPLDQLARASEITVTPETVNLRWTGARP
jgi:hypothetical protein